MRKELLVYVDTNESGEQISVASLASDRRFAIFNIGGHKAIIDVNDLQNALATIKEFNAENNEKEVKVAEVANYLNVEYGDKE